MTDKIKPCPFCGSSPDLIRALNESWVHCDCQNMSDTDEQAIKQWNKRSNEWNKTSEIPLPKDGRKFISYDGFNQVIIFWCEDDRHFKSQWDNSEAYGFAEASTHWKELDMPNEE